MRARHAGTSVAVPLRLLALLLPIAFAGCWSASFHASDETFHPASVISDPLVYLTRLPAEPFRSVGIIEVDGPEDSSVEQAVTRAVEKGREIGCQVLVWRRLARETAAGDRQIAIIAQAQLGVGTYNLPPGVTVGGRERPGKHQFLCGVWTALAEPGT
jgi:hypothetical protein